MQNIYKITKDHLLDELALVDLLVNLEVLKAFYYQHKQKDNLKKFIQSLNITNHKPATLIPNALEESSFLIHDSELMGNVEFKKQIYAINTKNKLIHAKLEASKQKGAELKLVRLCEIFHLSEIEMRIISICLAQQFNFRYEGLFKYIYDDPTKTQPCIDLIMDMLQYTTGDKLSAQNYFSYTSPLIKYKLLEFYSSNTEKEKPYNLKQLKINDRIYDFILNRNSIDSAILKYAELWETREKQESITIPENIRVSFNNFIERNKDKLKQNSNILFQFYGPYGSGKKDTAISICNKIGLPILIVDIKAAYNANKDFENILSLINRESMLQNSAVYYKHADYILQKDTVQDSAKQSFIKSIQENRNLIFIDKKEELEFIEELSGKELHKIEFSIPSYEERKSIWNHFMNGKYSLSEQVELYALAGTFQLTGGQIKNAIETAYNLSKWNSNDNDIITMDNLNQACWSQSNQNLKKFAQKIIPKYKWGSIVLPDDELAQLREITNHIKHKHIVLEDWGYAQKHPQGKGLNALFHGPSGTGKTMAAEIIANELAQDLYKIDISTIVSKYIGETEKNLYRIFKEAETSNAILFFDEADALFGRRSEVKDAHDRYANIEVGYLLQKMDEYEGAVILATNMLDNMDDAFVRRMHFIVEFPFPDQNQRLRIWQGVFTPKTPLDEGIDFDFLASEFNITGGNIKNISLASAMYAAGDGCIVTMKNILHATRRELNKIGRTCNSQDFGKYSELLN